MDEEARKKEQERRERSLMKKGWRWIKIKPTYSVFVPCDENGEPNERGKKIIEKHLDILDYKK